MATTKSLLPMRLKQLRSSRGLSQEVLAEKAGCSIETVSNIERGTNSPKLDTIEELAKALGVKAADLLLEEHPSHSDEAFMRLVAAARALRQRDLDIAVMQIEALASKAR